MNKGILRKAPSFLINEILTLENENKKTFNTKLKILFKIFNGENKKLFHTVALKIYNEYLDDLSIFIDFGIDKRYINYKLKIKIYQKILLKIDTKKNIDDQKIFVLKKILKRILPKNPKYRNWKAYSFYNGVFINDIANQNLEIMEYTIKLFFKGLDSEIPPRDCFFIYTYLNSNENLIKSIFFNDIVKTYIIKANKSSYVDKFYKYKFELLDYTDYESFMLGYYNSLNKNIKDLLKVSINNNTKKEFTKHGIKYKYKELNYLERQNEGWNYQLQNQSINQSLKLQRLAYLYTPKKYLTKTEYLHLYRIHIFKRVLDLNFLGLIESFMFLEMLFLRIIQDKNINIDDCRGNTKLEIYINALRKHNILLKEEYSVLKYFLFSINGVGLNLRNFSSHGVYLSKDLKESFLNNNINIYIEYLFPLIARISEELPKYNSMIYIKPENKQLVEYEHKLQIEVFGAELLGLYPFIKVSNEEFLNSPYHENFKDLYLIKYMDRNLKDEGVDTNFLKYNFILEFLMLVIMLEKVLSIKLNTSKIEVKTKEDCFVYVSESLHFLIKKAVSERFLTEGDLDKEDFVKITNLRNEIMHGELKYTDIINDNNLSNKIKRINLKLGVLVSKICFI